MILYKHFKLINSRTNRQLVVLPSLVVSPGVSSITKCASLSRYNSPQYFKGDVHNC
ncbi:hypothetical protein [Candidatus Tisiphia endosymbiont of Thecophora atra]|uniref:hypothetical protein n=1 Tax=Candidatus Tisiphia endosymbiont of Thecophora atra TaxID=3066258 RepID=UPI00312C6FE6